MAECLEEQELWYAPKPTEITEEQIACLSAQLEEYEPACTNF